MENSQTPQEPTAFPAAPQPQSINIPIAGGILLVVALISLALYMTMGMSQEEATVAEITNTSEFETDDTAIAALATQSTSDEITAIESDISATDLDSVMTYINEL